ncbi:MAG: S-layer family protein [Chroococcidiopsidaceae cyanobacterium CP_BM_RX_35]|nr:S-layer family protein [Chroococcidiopsidaceae cyanobacterium CP_BM_RX_35]
MPAAFSPSVLETSAFNTGKAGNLSIVTSRLLAQNGGRVDTATLSSGQAGNLMITASDTVEVSGVVQGSRNSSLIDSSANILDATLQKIYNLPPVPSGDAGNLTISTRKLSVINGASISVQNQGPGQAGALKINADSIFLENKGSITAASVSDEGGNIFLNAQNLQLRHNSTITATANGGSGNGGNITIDTGTLVALENSPITANAFMGRGGNIQIKAQGIFRSPDSPITASSQFGINGTVQFNIPAELNFARASSTPTPPLQSPQVTAVCPSGAGSQSSLVNSGTGGIPPSADSTLISTATWQDNFTPTHKNQVVKHKKHSSERHLPMPATGIAIRSDGSVAFVAANSSTPVGTSSGCSEANANR